MRVAANVAAKAVACALTLGSAWFLYSQTYATRRLEAQVQASERHRDRLENDIAVLKAERAHLTRPSRIEPAARAIGMRLPQPGDFVEMESLLPTGSNVPRRPTP